MPIYSIITGTGSCIPEKEVKNEDFMLHEFYDNSGERITTSPAQIVEKFKEITTIESRRYVGDNQVTSDLALIAAEEAIKNSGIDRETLDYIIFTHNFGETLPNDSRVDIIPSLASRLKKKLGIRSPKSVAYDVIFGCPGWVQGMIQANYYIKSGDAKKILVVGADVLSRVADPYDRDTMIYADGAGAVIVEAKESDVPVGILGHNSRSDAYEYAEMLRAGYSNNKELAGKKDLYLKMNGRRLYMYALENVPTTLKDGLDKLNIHINDISKILLHQANGKMDDAIVNRLYKLYDIPEMPEDIMPMSISWLGNSSVATVPTLFDLIMKGVMDNHRISSGEIIIFASVGAGMNINSIVYKMP